MNTVPCSLSPDCLVTVAQLLRTMERTDSQSITLFRNGSGHFVMGRFSAPAFQSLPDLSKFVEAINARPSIPSIQSIGSSAPAEAATQTANAS